MKKLCVIIIGTFISISLFSQDWAYRNGFATNHTLIDFNLKGKVKKVTETYFHIDEKGNKIAGNNRWFRMYKEHYNFNEHGNLISQYNEGEKGDTILIKINTYNEKQQIINSKMYKPHYNKKCVPSFLGNWDLDERKYSYKNGLLVEVTYIGQSFEYTSPSKMILEYDENGRLIHAKGKTTDENNDTLFDQEYFYDGNSSIIKEIKFTNTNERRDDGTLYYNYDKNGVLIKKQFTPYNVKDAVEWGSEESFYEYDVRNNLLKSVLGDSTKWAVYIYDLYSYNENNFVIKHENIMNYDGEGHSITNYEYQMDKYNNWITKTEIVDQKKGYPSGVKGKKVLKYINNRTITYFE